MRRKERKGQRVNNGFKDITIYLYASEAKYQARRVSSNQLFLDLKIPSKTIGDVEKQTMLRLFTPILYPVTFREIFWI